MALLGGRYTAAPVYAMNARHKQARRDKRLACSFLSRRQTGGKSSLRIFFSAIFAEPPVKARDRQLCRVVGQESEQLMRKVS